MGEKDKIVTEEDSSKKGKKPKGFLSKITLICRVWTFLVLIVMWVSGIHVIQTSKHESGNDVYIGWYLVGASILVTFLEITWIFDKTACCGREGLCCLCWSVIMWIDTWKRGILYIALSIPVFMEGLRVVLGLVSGFLLIISGCLYIVKTFRYKPGQTAEETQYVKTSSPTVKLVTHEIATQTEDDRYYNELANSQQTPLQSSFWAPYTFDD